MPTRGLTQWQAATETTWGTPVTATVKLMGMQDKAYLQSDNKADVYPDIRNSLQPGYLDGMEEIGGKGEYDTLMTFEDAPYYFDNACGQATPTGTGPYTRNWAAPVGTAPTPRILTMFHGNTQTGGGVYRLRGGLVNSIKIKGATGKPTMLSGDLIGQQVDTGSFAALSDRVVQVVMGQPWLCYIDAAGGTIGTTQVLASQVAFELKLSMNRVLTRSQDSLVPDGYEEGVWDGELTLTLRMNSTIKTEVDAMVGATTAQHRQIRVKQTSGTNVAQLDFAGTVKELPKTYDDEDGVLTVEVTYSGRYNTSLGNFFKAQIVNGVAVLA